MLDAETKRKIDSARDILVGKVPDPKGQVEQITTALIYKFMDDMDKEAEELGGNRKYFSGDFAKYSWPNLLDKRNSGQDRLNLYVEALQKMPSNSKIPPTFGDILKDAVLSYRDPETLHLFLKEIDGFSYDHSENLGNAFEYLLSILGSQGDAGQFRTPRHIIDFIVKVINPQKNETVLDPACGTAGFLISAYKHILEQNTSTSSQQSVAGGGVHPGDRLKTDEKKRLPENFVGYDISPDMVKLSLANMYLHDFPMPKIHSYDTLTSDDRWDENSDVILANPPFMSPKGGIRPHKRFSVQATRSEVLFVDYILEHLNLKGRAGIIVPEGIIFNSQKAYKQLRQMLVEGGLVAVVSLPPGVFNPYSGVKTSILIVDNQLAKTTDEILFLKIENDGFDLGAQRREIQANDLPEALSALQKWKTGKKQESTLAHWVKKSKIAENGDFNLTGERYKEISKIKPGKWPLVSLEELCEIKRGSTITKKKAIEGVIPVIAGGRNAAYYHNEANRQPPTITVSGSGAYAGYVNFFDQPIYASDCSTLQVKEPEKASIKFIYFVLKLKQDEIYSLQSGGGQPHVYPKDLKTLKVPLPPLEVQKDIAEQIQVKQDAITYAKGVINALERERDAILAKNLKTATISNGQN